MDVEKERRLSLRVRGRECKEPRKTHQGCCSSHGGFENNNCTGTQLLYNSSGQLICDDGTSSPSCIF